MSEENQGTRPQDVATGEFAHGSDRELLRPTVAFGPGAQTAKDIAAQRALPRVPGHDILEVIGQGGMGVVYKARQHGLKRLVALKMILSGAHAGANERARFSTEAEAVARLRHPHIVQVHEVGEWQPESGGAPLPYLSLEYVGGGSLAKHLKGTPQPPRFAAELLRALAEAIQYAHDHQVIHRDLKPANILLEGSDKESLAGGTVSQATPPLSPPSKGGEGGVGSTLRSQLFVIPKIADFGLAKQLDEQSGQTQSGAIMGTPSYMAPEQASGDASRIGPPVDIYALGAILYEVLTGRPPFKGTTLYETLDQVRHSEPVPPSRLQPKIPLDLETICLKCLQKEPTKRYATALALSADLRRFLANEPIQARPIGKLQRSWRWCLRNPLPAFLIGLVGVTLLVGLAVSSGFALWAVRGWGEADEQTNRVRDEKLKSDHRLYVAEFLSAWQKWNEGRADEVQEILQRYEPVQPDDPDLRSFEWHYLQRLCQLELRTLTGHTGTVFRVVCSPDGRWLATAGKDKTVQIWNRATGQPVHTLTHTKEVFCVAFSPDSTKIASAGEDALIRIWAVAAGTEIGKLAGHRGFIRSLTFRPDGLELASGADDNTVRLWDVSSGQFRELSDHAGSTRDTVLYGIDGKKLYSVGKTSDILVWDVSTGRLADKLTHTGRVNRLAISGDGRRLASYGQDQTVRIWDTSDSVASKRWPVPAEMVNCLALSPDGTRVVTAGRDRMLRVWNPETSKEVLTLRGHTAMIFSVTYSPDGWQLLSTCAHGTVRIWDANVPQEKCVVHAHAGNATGLAFSADGETLATCGRGIHLWNPNTGIRLKTLTGHPGDTQAVCFLLRSNQLASVGVDGSIRVWDVTSGTEVERLHDAAQNLTCLACSVNGRWLAAYALDGTVLVYDLELRRVVQKFAHEGKGLRRVTFHPSEPLLAITGDIDSLVIRNLETSAVVSEWKGDGKYASACAFSPDGRFFVAGQELGMWALESKTKRLTFRKDSLTQYGVTFSPDSRRVVAGGMDRFVRVWDAATGSELLALPGHAGSVRGVALSGDGLLLASVGEEGLLQIWDARPLTPERRDLREAASLVRFMIGRTAQGEEVLQQIRAHPGISESVRARALELAESQRQDAQ